VEKTRYWTVIRRTEPESRAERQHKTKFGRYWTVDKVPPRKGRLYTTHQSPYDPKPGYVGIWKGRTAPPPRVGSAAPRQWAAEPQGLRPYGLPPYKLREELIDQSKAITDKLKLSNDPFNLQRIRDLKAHILERRRHSGSLFQDRDRPTAVQFARGVRWAELESIEIYRRHNQLRWVVDARFTVENDIPFVDSAIAAGAGYDFQEVDTTVERRRKKYDRPLRERKKAGRKPIGPIAQTNAARMRKYRRNKILKRLLPTGVSRPGADQRGLPPSLPAPGYFIPTRGGGLIRVLGGSSRISMPASGVIMITPIPTPQQATSSLIGARTIPPLSEGDVAVIVLALERHARAVRAREAKRSVLAWRAARAAAQAASQA